MRLRSLAAWSRCCACRRCCSCFRHCAGCRCGTRKTLLQLADDLIRADARIDVFEFCLAELLAHAAADEMDARAPHGTLSLATLRGRNAGAVFHAGALRARTTRRRRAWRTKRACIACCRGIGLAYAFDEIGRRRLSRRARDARAAAAVREEDADRRPGQHRRARWMLNVEEASCCARCARYCIVRCRLCFLRLPRRPALI